MRSFALVITLVAAIARAQANDAGVLELPVQTVTPPAGPSVLDTLLSFFRPYGTLKPTIVFSAAAVESFSNANASAITAAANPVLATLPTESRLSFQIAQSRVGVWVNEKGPVRGHVEIDFIDFAKASPTVQALVRLRVATIEWSPSDAFTLSAGQDWDLHAPINPHGSNMVGARFLSGNSGFMRQQVKALGKVGVFELAGAVGMQGVNATTKDGALELALVPTFAVRAAALVAKGRIGLSALATSLRLNPGTSNERRALAAATTAFADVTFGTTTLRGELTLGRNMANLGALTLGLGSASSDVDEWGGFFSVRHGFSDLHFVYANAGLMRVLNREGVRTAYSYPALPLDGSLPATASAVLAGTGPGILHNAGITIGYELRINKNLAFMLEGFFLQTEHKLLDVDTGRFDPTRRALGGELTAFVTF